MTTAINIRKVLLLSLQALLISACSTPGVRYVECGDIVYIDEFPAEITLETKEPILTDMEGMIHAIGTDSVMVGLFEDSPCIRLYSPESGQKLGEFVHKGQGPGEFPNMPSNITIKTLEDREILSFGNFRKKQYFNMNIPQSLKNGREVYDTIIVSDNFGDLKYIMPMESDTLLWKYDVFTPIRILSGKHGQRKVLNLGNIEDDWSDYDLNITSFVPAYNSEGEMIAEAMIHLNQFNLYSLSDTTYRKTICVGQSLDNVERENNLNRNKRKRTYQDVYAIGDGFAFLYCGAQERDYIDGNFLPQIQFFTANGEPVLRINIPFPVNSFYVTESGNLYLFSAFEETEKLYKYEIEQVKELADIKTQTNK